MLIGQETPEERLRVLFEHYYAAVVGYFVRWGFPRDEEARDLAQEVFVRVFRNMATFRATGKWSYLVKTAKHIALNRIRDRGAGKRCGKEISLEDLLYLPEELAGNPLTGHAPLTQEEELIEREERQRQARRLRAAIAALPPSSRRSLLLWLGGLSGREIAHILRTTPDGVKGRLNQVRSELRAALGEEPAGLAWQAGRQKENP